MKLYIKDYPRPQFVRKEWGNLNGQWNFKFDDYDIGEIEKYYINFPEENIILVPYTYETKMSGIENEEIHNVVWYNKKVNISRDNILNKRTILHFEGSDYITKVWINGNYIGSNKGGYARFSFDIKDYVQEGENDITVRVEDSLSKEQPRGKQRYRKESWNCWYIQTTGIWKTVWIEYVSKNYIKHIKNTPDLYNKTLNLEIETNITESEFEKQKYYIEAEISFKDKIINKQKEEINEKSQKVKISINGEDREHELQLWSPNNPNLYDVIYRLYCENDLIDEVYSYFGIKEISIKDNKIFLNGEELYLKLILDQGYWKDSHLTPPDEDALITDIDSTIELGFNGVRKHQKIEDERFLYWCDKKGLLVWSEMANFYEFTDVSIDNFTKEWLKIVKQNYNHPSIMTWVPINESWGLPNISEDKKQQSFANSIYYLTKSIDDTRPVICNDGWEHTISDIITMHDYTQDGDYFLSHYIDDKDKIIGNKENNYHKKKIFAQGYKYRGQPIILSEYGGIAINSEKGWGYGKQVKDENELVERFSKLTQAIKNIPYMCGYCYTQLTDVQQEINGLMDEDRNYKVNPEVIRKVNNMKQ